MFLIAGKGNGQNGTQAGKTTDTVVPTEIHFHHISDQAVALDGGTMFLADGVQDYSWMRTGGLPLLLGAHEQSRLMHSVSWVSTF